MREAQAAIPSAAVLAVATSASCVWLRSMLTSSSWNINWSSTIRVRKGMPASIPLLPDWEIRSGSRIRLGVGLQAPFHQLPHQIGTALLEASQLARVKASHRQPGGFIQVAAQPLGQLLTG